MGKQTLAVNQEGHSYGKAIQEELDTKLGLPAGAGCVSCVGGQKTIVEQYHHTLLHSYNLPKASYFWVTLGERLSLV